MALSRYPYSFEKKDALNVTPLVARTPGTWSQRAADAAGLRKALCQATEERCRRLSIKLSSRPWKILSIDLLLARLGQLQRRPLD